MTASPANFIEIPAEARSLHVQRAPLTDRLPHFVGTKLSRAQMAKRLAALRIFLIGAGSVGRIVAAHCARLGVKEIKISDPKRYSSNLITQAITPSEIGKFKAHSTGRLAKSISPRTRVLIFDGPAQKLPRTAFADIDIVALATDNLSIEEFASSRCMPFGTSLIQGSVHGETLTAQVRHLSNRDPNGPCLCCQFGPEEKAALAREIVYSCEGPRKGQGGAADENPRTMSTSALCSLAADLLMTTLLRSRLELGPAPADTLSEYNCYTNRATTTVLKRNPNCSSCHEHYRVITLKRALPDFTLRELVQIAGSKNFNGAALVSFDDFCWAEAAACRCPQSSTAGRFIPAGPSPRCHGCGASFRVTAFMTRRQVPLDTLRAACEAPLRTLGVARADTLLLRLKHKPTLFRNAHNSRATHED